MYRILQCITVSLYIAFATATINGTLSVYKDGSTELRGYLARNDSTQGKLPVVIIFPDWNGQDDYERGRARQIAAELGYVALAADVYGGGKVGKNRAENIAFMGPFRRNATFYNQRLTAAVDHVRSMEFVDGQKVAAIGYCFGGTGVIHMVRAGDDISGAVSFHGGLDPPRAGQLPTPAAGTKRPQLLVTTGYNDPSIPPAKVAAFEREMDKLDVDWELVVYSKTYHSFTVPGSNHTGRAVYDKRADHRSWTRMKSFFNDLFRQ